MAHSKDRGHDGKKKRKKKEKTKLLVEKPVAHRIHTLGEPGK
ncbi:MAG TPA: hypothetical protein VFI02_08610 [Armatimonadota bacterium]|nr:hypothetical protein [Armatimonadota bacterium]